MWLLRLGSVLEGKQLLGVIRITEQGVKLQGISCKVSVQNLCCFLNVAVRHEGRSRGFTLTATQIADLHVVGEVSCVR